MELSDVIIKNFVKVVNNESTSQNGDLLYGTAVVKDEVLYVKLDGSEVLTPVNSTMRANDGDRVTVIIKNHSATITGNLTAPSFSSTQADDRFASQESVKDAIDWVKDNGASQIDLINMIKQWTGGAISDTTTIQGGWIATNTITADKIAIGDYTNYVTVDPRIETTYINLDYEHGVDGDKEYVRAMQELNYLPLSEYMPNRFIGNEELRMEGSIYNNHDDNSNIYPMIVFYDENKNILLDVKDSYVEAVSYVEVSFGMDLKIPDSNDVKNASYYRVCLFSDNEYSDIHIYADMSCRRKSSGSLIVDGSISSKHLTAENIVGQNGWINLVNGTFNYGNGMLSWDGTKLSMKGDIESSNAKLEGDIRVNGTLYITEPATSHVTNEFSETKFEAVQFVQVDGVAGRKYYEMYYGPSLNEQQGDIICVGNRFRGYVYIDKILYIGSNKYGYNDGQNGIYLASDGTIHLTRDTQPGIYFHGSNTTDSETFIRTGSTPKSLRFSATDGCTFNGDILTTGANLYVGYETTREKNILFYNTTASAGTTNRAQHKVKMYGGNANSTTAWGIHDGANNISVMIYADGNKATGAASSGKTLTVNSGVTFSATGTVSSSDERLKENFDTVEKYEEFFRSLKVHSFTYKNGDSGRKWIGLKAQDVEQELYNHGISTKDFAGFVEYNKSPNDDDWNGYEDEKGLRDGNFTYLTMHMVQKCLDEIDNLKMELNELRNKN